MIKNSEDKNLRLLFSPCHYLFDEISEGSEFSWAFNIGDKISTIYPNSVIVTGKAQTEKPKKYRIVEVQPQNTVRNPGIFGAFKFNWLYFKATKSLSKNTHFDVIHHVLPFAIGKTFNIFWILNKTSESKLVLGPVQDPLTYPVGRKGLMTLVGKIITKFLQPLLDFLSNKTVNKADKVIAIHNRAKSLLISNGLPENRIEIIPPGINVKQFKMTSKYPKDSEIVKLISVGSLTKRKGFDLILQALAMVTRKHKNVKLTILGKGHYKDQLEEQVSQLKIKEFVSFAGTVPNFKITEHYQKSHVYVSMSRSEGFATVCLEAMSSGLAVVSSKVGGFEDAIKDGKNGFLVEQEDYQALAKKIIHLIENPSLIEKFGRQARKDAEDNYDWDTIIIPKYLRVYKEVLSATSKPSYNKSDSA